MKIIISKYKKVADFCIKLFKLAELPLHYSKFSNKIYSNYQKLFLLIYKRFRKFTYEELFNDLEDNLTLRAYLGFVKLPDYTTLIKFAKSLPSYLLECLIIAFKRLVPKLKKVAIDSTGISLDNASPHYCKRIGLSTKRRTFMKIAFIFEIQNHIILLCKKRKCYSQDTKDTKPLIKKLAKYYHPKVFYADTGYDDNKIFQLVFEKLRAYPLILQKRLDVPKHKRKGRYRKETVDFFDYGEYLQRNKIETYNSMFKRRFASNVKSINTKCQKIEVYLRIVAYNIDRLIRSQHKSLVICLRIIRISY